jgi:hypothetical protein
VKRHECGPKHFIFMYENRIMKPVKIVFKRIGIKQSIKRGESVQSKSYACMECHNEIPLNNY